MKKIYNWLKTWLKASSHWLHILCCVVLTLAVIVWGLLYLDLSNGIAMVNSFYVVCITSIAIEVGQRNIDWQDLLADLIGFVIGLLLFLVGVLLT